MEKARKVTVKLFAVIAVAVTMLLCGVLIGCGNAQEQGEDCPSYIKHWYGFYMRAEIEENEAHDIDDVSMSILYGVDLDLYNRYRMEWGLEYVKDDIEISGIYMYAYDSSAYSHWSDFSPRDFASFSEILTALDVGSTNDGVYLIDEIPFIEEQFYEEYYGTYSDVLYGSVNLDNLRGTDYECINSSGDYRTCYKKINVKLPRELFTSDSGKIAIRIDIVKCHIDGSFYKYAGMPYDDISFDYSIDGNNIVISNAALGSEWVVDGTKEDHIEAKTKSSFNAKPIEETEAESDKIDEQEKIDTQSLPQFSGIEGKIEWEDDSGITHPAQYIKIKYA